MRAPVAALLAVLFLPALAAGAIAESDPPAERKPAIILSPPPEAGAKQPPPEEDAAQRPSEESAKQTPPEEDAAQGPSEESATVTPAIPPPIARKKPDRPKVSAQPPQQKAPAKKAAAKQAPAKQAPAKKPPARAAVTPPQQAKACDYCYGCESLAAVCRRKWVCGNLYSELKAAGLCRR